MSEVSQLLVRILKSMRFSDGQIVAAIKSACETEKPALVRYPTAGRGELWGNVLCRWMEDPKFVDESGQPRIIPVSGSPVSFTALVKQVIPGGDAKECLDGLLKMRSVARIGSRRVRLRSSVTIYSTNGATFVEGILLSIRELLRTVAWNLSEQNKSGKPPLFQRGVTGVEIAEDDLEDLLRMVNTHGMNLLETFNGWVIQRAELLKRRKLARKPRAIQPYVGVYLSRGR
jgi:hypothetical protein